MLIKYQRLFGIIRIIAGLLFFIYPVRYSLSAENTAGEDKLRWLFVLFFFTIYAISAIRNGIREINRTLPHFNLLRFFEASMNGFVSAYLLIVLFTADLNGFAWFFVFLLTIILILSMVRDVRMISIQYYDRKRKVHEKQNQH